MSAGMNAGLGATILRFAATVLFAFTIFATGLVAAQAQSSVRPPDNATSTAPPGGEGGAVPGNASGTVSDSEIWRAVRQGVEGTVSIPDQKSATLVQSHGESWRLLREGPIFDYMGMAILATLVLLAIFYAVRGRIEIEHGRSTQKIKRFGDIERAAHWLMAVSFIILGLTGLNITFGKDLIMPLIGKEAFGPMSNFLKYTHNYVAFAFMLGLAVAFVTWVIHNIPNRHDLTWIAKGGGVLVKGVHPPAKKFNAGQKLIFWSTMLGGLSLALSGWALMFPYEHAFFTKTFTTLSSVGIQPGWFGLPDLPYSPIQEQQFNSIWHSLVAAGMICIILAHIYIGSIGMEGAFDAMGTGEVDLNWAKEHHSLWVEEHMDDVVSEDKKQPPSAQPAE